MMDACGQRLFEGEATSVKETLLIPRFGEAQNEEHCAQGRKAGFEGFVPTVCMGQIHSRLWVSGSRHPSPNAQILCDAVSNIPPVWYSL